jgi:hypothetical protein
MHCETGLPEVTGGSLNGRVGSIQGCLMSFDVGSWGSFDDLEPYQDCHLQSQT